VNVPLFVRPPLKLTDSFNELSHDPLIVTRPVNIFVPFVLLEKEILPSAVVVPATVRFWPLRFRVDPDSMYRLAQLAAALLTLTVLPPSINTLSPIAGTEAPEDPPDVADQVED
jgi:hypothetical protein